MDFLHKHFLVFLDSPYRETAQKRTKKKRQGKKSRLVGGWVWDLANTRGGGPSIFFCRPLDRTSLCALDTNTQHATPAAVKSASHSAGRLISAPRSTRSGGSSGCPLLDLDTNRHCISGHVEPMAYGLWARCTIGIEINDGLLLALDGGMDRNQ
jgi:hypothetical protein